MDHVVGEMGVQATYECHPVFMVFVTMIRDSRDADRIMYYTNYSYFKGKEDV